MVDDDRRRKFLLNSFTEDGWFYIVDKRALLVTDDSEIKIGALVQFAYSSNVDKSKVRKGKIIMESVS